MDWNASHNGTFSDFLTKRNLFLLLLFWAGGLAILAIYGTLQHRFGTCLASPAGRPVFSDEGTGTFVVRRKDAGEDRPAYEVAFDCLRAENGNSGPFRTAAHKIVHIDNLHVKFLHASQGEDVNAEPTIRLGDLCSLLAPRRRCGLTDGGLGLLQEFWNDGGNFSISLDLTNTAEVRINQLEWEVCREGRILFHARCKRACLPHDNSYIILRGHAAVTVNGTTLESNCVAFDVQKNQIIVDGRYILTHAGERQFGTRSVFDTHLQVVDTES